MSRKLIKQTCAQWRSNIWLIIELMIVATAIWYLTDMVYLKVGQRNLPNGYHMEDVVVTNPNIIKGGPTFAPVPEGMDTMAYRRQGFMAIVNRLRDLPMVETVGYGDNALPYNYSFWGYSLSELDRGDSLSLSGNNKIISPEMIDIMEIKPVSNHTREELKAILERGDYIVSSNILNVNYYRDRFDNPDDATVLIGQRFFRNDSADVHRVGAVMENIRRNDYEPASRGSILSLYNLEKGVPQDLAIKVKPGRMGELIDYFESHRGEFNAGNVNLVSMSTIDSVRDANQRDIYETQRNLMVILAFLLCSIFLGILGTFWFRTQERVGEIAIRKVNGATSGDILRRLMGEGILLLVIGVVLSIGLDWLVVRFELGTFVEERGLLVPGYGVWQAYPVTLGFTFLVMCAMVCLGIWFPARRAMAIDPAVALQDE
ncbi:MAG: FtsX-like permease family protein [Pseudoflavonifractor sp.]|nr:FtsX-like permease family protein [Alloprevotella sp.]MCM1116033.1 FtsX-like permease family protein [Pseudoflavonifractor sp.]